MPDVPNDRPNPKRDKAELEPRIFAIVGGEQFSRPGLETFFAQTQPPGQGQPKPGAGQQTCSCHPVTGTYCSCNKVSVCQCVPVCTCQAVCGCVGHVTCSCVGHTSCSCNSRGHSYGGGCRCAPVH